MSNDFKKMSILKTLYFNFKCLPFKQAIKLPILLSKNVYIKNTLGKIHLKGEIKPRRIKIGFGQVGIISHKYTQTIWDVIGNVHFMGTASLGSGTKLIIGKNTKIEFGDNFHITAESSIISAADIYFGDNCLLSWDILIMNTDFHKIYDINGTLINEIKPIYIGNKVWINCRCMIFKGAHIPDACVIGAGSLVNKVLEKSNSIYAGSPAKLIQEGISWEI